MNEPGAIIQAASKNPRLRNVKNRYSKVPLIHACKIGVSVRCLHGICQDTMIVAEDLQCLPKYLEEIRGKSQHKGAPGVDLTEVFDS